MDLSAPIRTAIIGESSITSLLTAYKSSWPVFTRRPAPNDATLPIILISPDIAVTDEDGVSDFRPIIVRDISVYGRNDEADQYRAVEQIGYALRNLFHRQRSALTVSGWTVMQIIAAGPMPAPVDDEQSVGRLVELTVHLASR